MSELTQGYQQRFFERLGRRFTSRSELVQAVAEDLHLGRDAIYRRLRGDTSLTADEMMRLADIYHLRTDTGPQLDSTGPCLRYPDDWAPIHDEYDYFVQLHNRWEKLKRLPGANFDLASPELPMQYELSTPVLRAFKIYMYGVTTWKLKKWEGLDFSPGLISTSLHDLVDGIVVDHYSVSARELWSIGILDVTLRQIGYVAQVGKFADPEDLDRIFAELYRIVDHLERMVRTGKRFPLGQDPGADSSEFEVYHNELSNTSNVILVKSDLRPFLFTTLVTPNYVATSDPDLCAETQQWFDNLVKYGSPLNAGSAKYAAQYFGYLRGLIRKYEERTRVGQYVF